MNGDETVMKSDENDETVMKSDEKWWNSDETVMKSDENAHSSLSPIFQPTFKYF